MSRRTLAVVVGVQVLIAAAAVTALFAFASQGDDGGASERVATTPAGAGTRVDRFDGRRAFALLRAQVRFGPRPAASAASRRTSAFIRRRLPRGRFEALREHPGLRNVVGVLPGRRPAIVVAAHYDTEATVEGHVGANDGAAGTAAVLELARALGRERVRAPRELRFVLFDGEEEPRGCPDAQFQQCALRGSKDYARRHARELRALVLLDYIAGRGTRIPMEGQSDAGLWSQLRTAARRVGTLSTFPDAVGPSIVDDHVPFLEQGVPAIDLIDFDYPVRDTRQDDLGAVSERSLDAVGETVLELLRGLRRR